MIKIAINIYYSYSVSEIQEQLGWWFQLRVSPEVRVKILSGAAVIELVHSY